VDGLLTRIYEVWFVCRLGWRLVDSLEQAGEMAAEDAVRWKHGIFRLMMLWGLEPDDLVPPVLM
jgi:hypothetical protein